MVLVLVIVMFQLRAQRYTATAHGNGPLFSWLRETLDSYENHWSCSATTMLRIQMVPILSRHSDKVRVVALHAWLGILVST